ncbi:MAG TPA: hypothetical protein VFN61_09380 [Acidimicrobiales bacterium]|nr:hypothetical protein [Acidimicrobiales bacterium]
MKPLALERWTKLGTSGMSMGLAVVMPQAPRRGYEGLPGTPKPMSNYWRKQ